LGRRATRHWIDAAVERLPVLQDAYWRNSARLKKAWCLARHRVGLLKPSAFVLWIATYRCNFHCPFCEAGAGEPGRDELTTGEAETLLADLGRMGVRRLLISGGEPAMRRDLPTLLDTAGRLSITPAIISNGYLIEDRWHELRPFQYFLYMTSVDGLPEQHDGMRGKGSYERALRALELFAGIGVRTRVVNTVVHRDNLAQLPELAERLAASAATDWYLTPVLNLGRARGRGAYQMSGDELKAMMQFVRSWRGRAGFRPELGHASAYLSWLTGGCGGRPSFCGAGLTRCAVMPNGDVLPCGQAYDAVRPEGNIRDRPLSEIWKCGFRNFRRFEQPPACRDCPHWSACQGGCWAVRAIRGCCLRDVWTGIPCHDHRGTEDH
jgi:radical SAM protein with 4Fe4S-binding SPASM domain